MANQLNPDAKNLVRRYLLWCYKTTKEEFERIERKFTQLLVDEYVFDKLKKLPLTLPFEIQKGYLVKLDEFKNYIDKKRHDALTQKFSDQETQTLKGDYLYLRNRLTAIEKAIVHFLGPTQLKVIKSLYEKEMTERILTAREH